MRECSLVGVHLSCVGFLLLVLVNSINRNLKFDTRALIKVKDTRDAEDFFAFSICPTFNDAFKEEQLYKYGLTKEEYKDGNYTGTSTDGDAWEIFRNVTWNIEDLISALRVETLGQEGEELGNEHMIYLVCQRSHNCPAELHFNNGLGRTVNSGEKWNDQKLHDLYNIKEHYHHGLGRCFEIQFTKNLVKLGIYSVVFQPVEGKLVYIYVNTPGQFKSIDENTKLYTTLGAYNTIDIQYTVQVDNLEEESRMPCSSEMDQKLDECIYYNTAEHMMQHFNCVLPFLPRNDSQSICQSMNPLMHFRKLMNNNQRSMCQLPCKKIKAYFGVLRKDQLAGSSKQNLSYVRVYVKSTVTYIETVIDYPLNSMLAGI